MAERHYECMFVLDSSRFATDPAGTEAAVRNILADRCGAEVVAAAPWQDGKLPYPIEGHARGLHYLTYLRMDGSQVTELARQCKLSDLILRHLVIDHSEHPALFDQLVNALSQHTTESDEAETAPVAAASSGDEEEEEE